MTCRLVVSSISFAGEGDSKGFSSGSEVLGDLSAGEVLLSCTVAAALEIDVGEGELYIGPIPILHLPQFALRGRSAPLDIWCVPATERLAC